LKICGTEEGKTIWRNICFSLVPNIRATLIISESTSFTPSMAFVMMISIVEMKIMKYLLCSPIPNQRIAKGIHAMDGIERSTE
jgi:hypothetical protein